MQRKLWKKADDKCSDFCFYSDPVAHTHTHRGGGGERRRAKCILDANFIVHITKRSEHSHQSQSQVQSCVTAQRWIIHFLISTTYVCHCDGWKDSLVTVYCERKQGKYLSSFPLNAQKKSSNVFFCHFPWHRDDSKWIFHWIDVISTKIHATALCLFTRLSFSLGMFISIRLHTANKLIVESTRDHDTWSRNCVFLQFE